MMPGLFSNSVQTPVIVADINALLAVMLLAGPNLAMMIGHSHQSHLAFPKTKRPRSASDIIGSGMTNQMVF